MKFYGFLLAILVLAIGCQLVAANTCEYNNTITACKDVTDNSSEKDKIIYLFHFTPLVFKLFTSLIVLSFWSV